MDDVIAQNVAALTFGSRAKQIADATAAAEYEAKLQKGRENRAAEVKAEMIERQKVYCLAKGLATHYGCVARAKELETRISVLAMYLGVSDIVGSGFLADI